MENKNLEIVIQESGLETVEGNSLMEKFGSYESIANEWEFKAKSIVVTDASQVTEMEMAKVAAKKFADLRIELEKARKAMKEQSLRKGQAIDAVAKYLQSLISPIEEHLKLQANFVKIQEEKKMEALRLEAEKKLEEERLAKEEADRKEQERVRLENEKLRKELEEKEKQARLEREEASRKLQEEQDKANKARLEQERKMAEQKLEADRKRKELEEKLAKLIKCPNCGHEFENGK